MSDMNQYDYLQARALVIGNNLYQHIGQIQSCQKDADDVGDKLTSMGYSVTKCIDGTKADMDAAIDTLCTSKTENDSIVVIYYSGHGGEIDGENYIIGTDFDAKSMSSKETIIKSYLVGIDDIITKLDDVGYSIKVIILDACRTSIIHKSVSREDLSWLNSFTKIRSKSTGVYIAFATSFDDTSLGYKTPQNSLYTKALLDYVEENIPIEDCFKKVRKAVIDMNVEQLPWEYSSLITNFSFNLHHTEKSTNAAATSALDATILNLIQNLQTQPPQTSQYKYEIETIYTPQNNPIDKVIVALQSHNWYMQNSGMSQLTTIDPQSVDKDLQFLLGRNLLQTALGGEYSAIELFKRLNIWLRRWNNNGGNHVLNGMLYEMYFDKEATFRGINHLKSGYVDELFALSRTGDFTSSFDYISGKLSNYEKLLYFMPSRSMRSITVEIKTRKVERTILDKYKETFYEIEKILLNNVDISTKQNIYYRSISFDELCEKLRHKLCVDKYNIAINIDDESVKESSISVGDILIDPKV